MLWSRDPKRLSNNKEGLRGDSTNSLGRKKRLYFVGGLGVSGGGKRRDQMGGVLEF